MERPLAPHLATHVADALDVTRADLAARWHDRAQVVAPRAVRAIRACDATGGGELCAALVVVLRGSARGKDAVMRAGWELGDVACQTGATLHELLKLVDLLAAILLHAAERAAEERPGATAAEGIGVARRLGAGASLLVLAASRGFMHAHLVEQRRRFRALRHDLRNPIGSIQGAVSLMEDPNVSPDMRNDPRFRAMVARNASALELLVGDRLSDAATLGPALALCDVSLHDVALAVRRDLRDAAQEAGCGVAVSPHLPTVRTDSTTFELALRSLVSDALWVAAPGATVHVGLRQLRDRVATIEVAADALRPDTVPRPADALGFARELSALTGGRVWEDGGALCLEIPLLPRAEARHDRARVD